MLRARTLTWDSTSGASGVSTATQPSGISSSPGRAGSEAACRRWWGNATRGGLIMAPRARQRAPNHPTRAGMGRRNRRSPPPALLLLLCPRAARPTPLPPTCHSVHHQHRGVVVHGVLHLTQVGHHQHAAGDLRRTDHLQGWGVGGNGVWGASLVSLDFARWKVAGVGWGGVGWGGVGWGGVGWGGGGGGQGGRGGGGKSGVGGHSIRGALRLQPNLRPRQGCRRAAQ
jgi:hypothetical protein